MPFKKRRGTDGLPEDQRAALKNLVAQPKFELIPLSNVREKAEALPPRAVVTVTTTSGGTCSSTASSIPPNGRTS